MLRTVIRGLVLGSIAVGIGTACSSGDSADEGLKEAIKANACGNGVCSGRETCTSCPQDCGACPPRCGDGSTISRRTGGVPSSLRTSSTPWSLWRARHRPALGGLGLAAGLATLPVAGQLAWEAAARLLVVAGPLWLAFVAATSALLWQGSLERTGPEGEPS